MDGIYSVMVDRCADRDPRAVLIDESTARRLDGPIDVSTVSEETA